MIDAYREELRPGRLLSEIDYVVSARVTAEAARRLPGEGFMPFEICQRIDTNTFNGTGMIRETNQIHTDIAVRSAREPAYTPLPSWLA